jgi:hypothetical protein
MDVQLAQIGALDNQTFNFNFSALADRVIKKNKPQ